jgi:hypothetical protein
MREMLRVLQQSSGHSSKTLGCTKSLSVIAETWPAGRTDACGLGLSDGARNLNLGFASSGYDPRKAHRRDGDLYGQVVHVRSV